jgi:AcrR family transcriptional regulator
MARKNYRDEIIESAKQLLAARGYENMNMRGIAKGAGIKAASIYNHFRNKDEIIYRLILDGRLELANRIQCEIDKYETPFEKIMAYYDAFIKFGFENKEYYKIMFMNSYPAEAMRGVKDDIAREIEPGLKTLSRLIAEYSGLPANESMTFAESLFHMTHGHISLSILNRPDFLFDVDGAQITIRGIISEHLSRMKSNKNTSGI